ncbi:hypothetical protein LINPERHAP2_LOCUS20657 [Linum perenne]
MTEALDKNPNDVRMEAADLTRPPDDGSLTAPFPPPPHDPSSPDALLGPRKRLRENLQNHICQVSDLVRPTDVTAPHCRVDQKKEQDVEQISIPTSKDTESDTGAWMTVQRKGISKATSTRQPRNFPEDKGSRFKVLDDTSQVNSTKPTNAIVTPVAEKIDVQIAEHASMLADILAKASKESEGTPKKSSNSRKQKDMKVGKPLSDISNLEKANSGFSTQQDMPNFVLSPELNPNLISVPVVYQNPTFVGSPATQILARIPAKNLKRVKDVAIGPRLSQTTKQLAKDGK